MNLLSVLSQPYQLNEKHNHVTASIGVALFREKQDGVDELLKRADLAMYQAKASGRNSVRFFDPAMQALVDDRSQVEAALRQAIAEKEFVLFYQPQVTPKQQIVAVEALLRWQHPQRGLISPFEFIGLAEETGLIWDIGLQVMHQACEQLKLWQQSPASAQLNVSVNISAYQFHHPDFVSSVLVIVEAHQIDVRFLMLEITESLLLNNVNDVVAKMATLKSKGIRFSIDDFGTGYSSLAYLKRLPLDELKIDRSFVVDIKDNSNVIVTAFLSLAHLLGLHVVAEGVETEEQQSFLISNGCDLIQGFLFSRPVLAEQITQMLQK
jgi:EAL domain-containing protein (putative c-di-GMP-specific phosphodiesterase class I)